MLLELSLENLLSFAERTTLDLRAAPDAAAPLLRASCPLPGGPGAGRALRTALLVGKNGAGKTNLIKALVWLRSLLVTGVKPGKPLPLQPFLLLREPRAESRVALSFLHDGVVWHYGLTATRERVTGEWLRTEEPGKSRELFVRNAGAKSIALGELTPAERKQLELVTTFTRPEQPLLSEALRQNAAVVAPVGAWLRDRLQLIRPEAKVVGLAARMARDPRFAEFLSKLVAEADLGVAAVTTRRTAIDHSFFESEAEEREVLAALTGYADGFVQTPEGEIIAERDPHGTAVVDLVRVSLVLVIEQSAGGRMLELPLADAPDGLLRLLHLAPALYPGEEPLPPRTFLVDELDRSLHPELSQALLRRFEAAHQSHGPHGTAQLIATTHDLSLVAALDPGQVYRLSRGDGGGTRIERGG